MVSDKKENLPMAAAAIETVRQNLEALVRDELAWEVSPATLNFDPDGYIVWQVQPRIGGPVRISHGFRRIDQANAADLLKIALELLECGREIQRYSRERADYEQEFRAVAKSLLRRKAAHAIRLRSLLSQPIATDYYSNIGIDVTFEWDDEGLVRSKTYEVWEVNELRDAFDSLLRDAGAMRHGIAA
jgi:hypothetical protein